jgi:hypothetical protein
MKHKLLSVALITVLLCLVVGNSIGCTTPAIKYTLTIASTAGYKSITPAIGTYLYAAGTVVDLNAIPDSGYRFVKWTAGIYGNSTVAQNNFTMPAQNVVVTAHFALGKLIEDVPDTNQPPTQTLNTTINITNYCAPIAMANILEYWDDVANHANAQNVTAGLIPETVAEYLGYFMDTNNNGSLARANNGQAGTKEVDIIPGTLEYVSWDSVTTPVPVPPWPLPAGKLGYNWSVLKVCDTNYTLTLDLYKHEINTGHPLVVSFDYWNPMFGVNVTDPQSGETISVCVWGTDYHQSYPPDPEEKWDYGDIGHAVTGVGYILNWDPDGLGPLPLANWTIVHDNWNTTPKNVAVPWANWDCLFPVSP